MIAQLSIRDIVLIDRLDLTFADGLSVLTGETGAGKSILLDAAALALGGRGDAGLVRMGQDHGQVTVVFDVPTAHPARAIAAEAGLDVDGDIVLRRVQHSDGRTRAFVNDQAASAQALRAIGAALVEIHGQHADRALVEPTAHRALLDAFAGLGDQTAGVRETHRAWREARRAVEEAHARLTKARAEGEYLRHAVEELAKLKPEQGEETALAARRQAMMQSEKIAADLADAADAISGPNSPVASLSGALRRLDRRGQQSTALIEPITKALGEALDRIEEARLAVEAAQRAADFDPRELERIEERLFALRAASRKFACPVEGLEALTNRLSEDLAALDAGEDHLAKLEAAEAAAAGVYRGCAEALSAARRAAAKGLDAAVNAELKPLRLDNARFITEIVTESEGPDGADRVEFHVQTNPGTRPGPMMKVASGGELSRFMLALKVVLADKGSAPTLVFDEIDTGVGGAVADAIGQRLARLSRKVQVLSVTHAPQVAARASRHYLIAKEAVDQRVATRVKPLGFDLRREELARMLAGETITDEARAAAERLLQAG